ncbi:MAG: hypothetical protein Q8Q89_04975 [bacterium]|nr:hypothetical protein [bacterium]
MIIIFSFLLCILLENLLLPALMGPKPVLITPLFVFALVIYDYNIKLRLVQAVIFLTITEFFSASGFGSMVLPFIIVIGLYLWVNRFLDIRTSLRESNSFLGLFGGAFFLALLVFIYSYVFLFLELSNNIIEVWKLSLILIKTSIYQIWGWAWVFVVLFRYVYVFQKR